MNEQRTMTLLTVVAVVVWLIGLGWSVLTFRQLHAAGDQLHRRESALASMRALEAESLHYAAARARVRAESGQLAVPNDLAVAQLPGARTDEARMRRASLGEGWTQLTQDLVFDDVSIAGAMKLADVLESQRPPWRLAAVEIRALPHAPGIGQVAFTVTAIQAEP
ncbi:MAG: hypothetical protein O3B24_03360 [Verrucomicrobia bacterium]|nr:hypothetical protein [Verrucomicrobiota bacterium]